MIAAILNPLSVGTALYFPWFCGKCHSGASRGTTGRSSQKNQASELLPRPDPHGAGYIRPRLHLNLYYRSNRPCQTGERFAGLGVLVRRRHRRTAVWFHFVEDWFDMRDLGAVLDHEEPLPPSRIRSDAITSVEINRGSGGRLKKRPQRRASADRTRNPTKGSRVAKLKFRCLGTKDGTGSAKLPAV